MFKSCCSKIVCHGCILASHQRGMGERCAFCRTPTPDSDADTIVQVQERVDAKDPVAIDYLAHAYWKEDHGLQKDIPRAIELWTEAARLGDLDAHINLGTIYCYGRDVEQDGLGALDTGSTLQCRAIHLQDGILELWKWKMGTTIWPSNTS